MVSVLKSKIKSNQYFSYRLQCVINILIKQGKQKMVAVFWILSSYISIDDQIQFGVKNYFHAASTCIARHYDYSVNRESEKANVNKYLGLLCGSR